MDEEDKRPVTSWNRYRLTRAIRRWGGAPDDWQLAWATRKSKYQLLDYARQIYPYPKYKIQKVADKFSTEDFSIEILLLPVAHPELNPIKMVWAFVKRAVASRNMMFKLSHVEQLTNEQLSKVTARMFKKFYNYAILEENKYKRLASQ